jgi:hypothetical protein
VVYLRFILRNSNNKLKYVAILLLCLILLTYFFPILVSFEEIPGLTFGSSDDILPSITILEHGRVIQSDLPANATNSKGTVVQFNALANDNVDGYIQPICTPPSGSIFPLGNTTVKCNATDKAGNENSTAFNVMVRDNAHSLDPTPQIAFADNATGVNLEPPTIQIKITDDESHKITPYSLEISSAKNIKNVTAHFTDLQPAEGGGLWLTDVFRLSPSTFNITQGQVVDAKLLANISGHPGSYTGKMSLWSSSGIGKIADIPINVQIMHYSFYPILALAAGLIAGFFVKYIKQRVDMRDDALTSLDKAVKAVKSCVRENRRDVEYGTGNDAYVQGTKVFVKGSYGKAKEYFDAATDSYYKAKTSGNGPEPDIDFADFREMTEKAPIGTILINGATKSDTLYFILTTVVLFIAVMQAWTQFSSKLSLSGESLTDFITAFILGYGSQSLLGEALEISKRKT